MWRKVIIIAAIVAGAIGGVAIALQSPRVAYNMKARLMGWARTELGVELTIDRLHLRLLPPIVEAEGIRVWKSAADRASEPPWIALHDALVQIRPWPSTTGAIVIDRLELDGLRADFDLSGMKFEGGDDAGSTSPVDIVDLALWDARVSVRFGERLIELESVDLESHPGQSGNRNITIDIPRARVSDLGHAFTFEARARAALKGSVDRPTALTIESAQLFTQDVSARAAGTMGLGPNQKQMQLRIESTADLQRISSMIPALPRMDGDAEITAEIKTNPVNLDAPPLVRIDMHVDGAIITGQHLGMVDVSGLYNGATVALESFRVAPPGTGAVTGSGSIELTEGYPISFTSRAHSVSLPRVLAKSGIPESWIRMQFSGDVLGSGRATPFFLDLRPNVKFEHFQVLDRSYTREDAVPMLSLEDGQLRGTVHLGTRAVELAGLEVTRGSTSLTVDGRLSYNVEEGLDLRTSGQHAELADLGPIASAPMSGHGPIAATIEGPYTSPTISATAELDDFSMFDYFVGDTKATLIYANHRLGIDRMRIVRGNGTTSGSGRLRFDGPIPTIEAAFDLQRVALADILRSAGLPPAHTRRFEARTSGRVLVSGAMRAPDGILSLSAPQVSIDGVDFGRLNIEGGFGENFEIAATPGRTPEAAWVNAQMHPKGGKLKARLAIQQTKGSTTRDASDGGTPTLSVSIDAANVPLASLRSFMGDVPISGSLTATAELTGPATGLSGPIKATALNLTAWGMQLATTHLSGDAIDGRVSLDGTLLDSAATMQLTLDLGEQLPYTTTINCTAIDVNDIFPLKEGLGITLSGSIFSQGDFTRPATNTADFQIPDGTVSWKHLELKPARPIQIQLVNGVYQINDLVLAAPGIRASVGGLAPIGQDLDLRLIAEGDLHVATALFARVQAARGQFATQLAITGAWGDPEYTGDATVTDGHVRLKGLAKPLENISVRAAFAKRDIEIRNGRATLGQGGIRFGGQVSNPVNEEQRLNLHASFDDLSLNPTRDLAVSASGDVNLRGPAGDLILKGDVRLASLRFTKNLELDVRSLLPRRGAPLHVPALTAEDPIALRIRLSAPDNILISGSQIEAELAADLMITGTTQRIGAIGTITPLWAQARLRDMLFDVEGASIDLVEEYSVLAQYDITAITRACDMDLTVNVRGDTGPESDPVITPSAKDENGVVDPSDALSCIQIGIRMSELANNDAGAVQDAQLGALGALLSVSGVDRQLQRFFPVKLDEIRVTSGRSPKTRRTTPRIVLSKDIGSNIELRYNGSLSESNDHILSVEYNLSPVATIESSWVSVSDVPSGDFGLDLRLRWEFQ